MKRLTFLLMQLLPLAVSTIELSPEPASFSPLPEFCGPLPDRSVVEFGNDTHLVNYRWMVALGYKHPRTKETRFLCSGSVISERYVLTVANCVTPKQPDVIRLGEWDLATDIDCTTTIHDFLLCAPQPVQVVEYEEIVVHPTYNKRGSLSDNIALIRLAEPIDFKKNWMIRPICLPEPDFDVRADGTATVTSWDFPRSSVLRKARLDSVDVDHCSISPRGIILDGQICFRTQDDILCGGDSGSPVVMPTLTSSKFIQSINTITGHLGKTSDRISSVVTWWRDAWLMMMAVKLYTRTKSTLRIDDIRSGYFGVNVGVC
ncbi:phenoloxidase-activating factor 1-like isoform X2 [Scylla paramamosain]